MYSFEKLDSWVDARKLVKGIYEKTSKFPAEEKFGLVMQLRKAGISIVSNLAEGSARMTAKDQAHFTNMAYSSLIEVLNQLILAGDLNFLDIEILKEGRQQIDSLAGKIAALRKSQLNRIQQ